MALPASCRSNEQRLADARHLQALTATLDIDASLYRRLFPEVFAKDISLRQATLGLDYVRASQAVLELDFPGETLRLAQDQRSGVLGAVVWDCGEAMARFLADKAELVAGRGVIDLGTGTGIAGIAAVALAGASRCALSDTKDCETIARESLSLNADVLPADSCVFTEFDWGAENVPQEVQSILEMERPVILISDCLYQFHLMKLLMKVLTRLAHPNVIVIWTYKVRIVAREASYIEVLQSPVDEGGAGMSFYRGNWDASHRCGHERFSDVNVLLSALRGGPADLELSELDITLAPVAEQQRSALGPGWQEHLQGPIT